MPQRTIEENMRTMNQYLSEYLDSFSDVEGVSDIFRDIKETKGKQLRPKLLLLCGMFGTDCDEASDRLCRLAAMIEAVHMASLIHDDVADDSLTRRGMATIQGKYGKKAAVYAGDLMISALSRITLDNSFIASGKIIAETVSRMCCGEIGQMRSQYDVNVGMEQYMAHINGKTVAMFEAACEIGAKEGGCDDETAEKIKNMGTQIGTAFQLRDDLLDILGDERKEGKPMGMDLKEGAYTMPVIVALSDERFGKKLRKQLLNKYMSKGRIKKAVSLVKESKGIAKTYAEINSAVTKAREILLSLGECGATAHIDEILRFIEKPI